MNDMQEDIVLTPDEQIKRYSQAIGKGLSGVGLHRAMQENRVQAVCEAVFEGDAEGFSALVFDTIGEAAGLAAGESHKGKEALDSLLLAQADCFIALREANDNALKPSFLEDMAGTQALLIAHQEQIYEWIETGETRIDGESYECDLSLIGAEFLTTPEYRAGAMASVVAGLEVLHQGLALFTGYKAKKTK